MTTAYHFRTEKVETSRSGSMADLEWATKERKSIIFNNIEPLLQLL